MREVVYTDKQGRKFRRGLPDNAPDSDAKMGLDMGPPDLSALKLPVQVEVRLNNALFSRKIFTAKDARNIVQLQAALQEAYRVDAQTLQTIYEG